MLISDPKLAICETKHRSWNKPPGCQPGHQAESAHRAGPAEDLTGVVNDRRLCSGAMGCSWSCCVRGGGGSSHAVFQS